MADAAVGGLPFQVPDADPRGSRGCVAVLGDEARKETLLLGRGYLPVVLDSEVLGESRSRKLVMEGEEGATPDGE